MQERQPGKYELIVSAAAVAAQVGALQYESADALFSEVAGISVAGLRLLLEEWALSASLGEPLLYRLLLRAADHESLTQQS